MGAGKGKTRRIKLGTATSTLLPVILDENIPLAKQSPVLSELVKSLTDFSFAGLHPECESGFRLQNTESMRLQGTIRSITGEQKGEFTIWLEQFELDKTPIIRMKPAYFRLDEEEQGQGFGSNFFKHRIDIARSHGVSLVNIWAVETGSYAWASQEFLPWKFESDYDEPFVREPQALAQAAEARSIFNRGHHTLEQLVREKRVTQSELDDFKQAFLKDRIYNLTAKEINSELQRGILQSPNEIAQYGKKKSWVDKTGERMWLGKALLLAEKQDWRGYCWLK